MSIIWKTHVWSTMQIWSENWMWWNLLIMNHFQFTIIHKLYDLLFTLLFRWRSCPILAITNISTTHHIRTLLVQIKPTRLSSFFNLVFTSREWTPHSMLECLIEWATYLEEVILTNLGIGVGFICNLSFQSDPIRMWHGFLFEQLPNT
jgi:hypothetical protein